MTKRQLQKRITLDQQKRIQELARQYRVVRLYVFGSALTEDFRPDSDIDLLVEFDSIPLLEYGDNYFAFQKSLANLLGRKVDLVIEKDLVNPVLIENIRQNRTLLYAKKDSEVAA